MQSTPPVSRLVHCLRILAILLVAIVFTLLCVAESKRNGRLASSPNYDDVVYFHDGSILLHSLQSDGWAGFKSFLAERGLHSPYSIFLAAAAFRVFGFQDASPYLANGLVVLVYLLGVSWFLRRLPIVPWVSGILLFLAPPFITMGVVEFRPDIAWAVTTGFGVVLIVTSEELFRRPGRAAVAALFLALSLLIKPSTFVMTAILYMGAIFSRIAVAVWEKRWRSSPRTTHLGVVAFVVTVLIVAGPYWIRFGKYAWDYFFTNSFGINKEIWAYKGSLKESLLFYISGEGSQSNVAIAGKILSVLSLFCLGFLAIRKKELRWKLFVLLGLMAGALLVNTVAGMKSPFLGGGIYGVWLFSCAYVIATAFTVLKSEPGRGIPHWITFALPVTAALALLCYRWPAYSRRSGDRVRINNYRAANDHILALLDKHVQAPPKSVFFIQAGPIVMESAGIWFPRHGLKTAVSTGAFLRSEEEFGRAYPNQEWIVLQEQAVMGATSSMPSESLLPKFVALVTADPHYEKISEFTAMDGKKVWVYARKKV
jgi:hypothetical protein